VAIEAPEGDDGAAAVVRVKDSGVGISDDALTNLFEEQKPVDASRGPHVGLLFVRRVVEMHGGAVTVRTAPNDGAEFEIRLPALPQRVVAPPVDDAGEENETPEPGPRVLVVDDNVDSARSLGMLLEASGAVVEIAFDGLEAVEAAERTRPDVVLLDIGMPKLDGFAAARWIRAQPWARDVKIVALTGWGREDVRANARQAGFDAHLVKPVDFGELSAFLATLPGGRLPLVATH